MNESEIKYLIALTQVEGVGPIIAKELLEFFGSAEALFKEDPRILCSLRKYGQKLSQAIQCRSAINRAEKELDYMVKEGISGGFTLCFCSSQKQALHFIKFSTRLLDNS